MKCAECEDQEIVQQKPQTQASEMVQQQVVAPPPIPVVPPATVIPSGLVPVTRIAPWIIPFVIPGGLLNPLPTANDQIDPRTGRPRFPQEQPQLPASIPLPKPRRYPNQTCEDERMAELEKEMHNICDKGFSCSDNTEKLGRKKENRLRREQLLENIARSRDCLKKRQDIQDECFKNSTDPRHEKAIREVAEALKKCLEKYIMRHGQLP